MKLNPKIIKIKAKILTSIHIDNNEILDRMDYFTFDWWNEIQILDRKWLNFCAEKDRELFDNIIKNIELGNFLKVEDYKYDFYTKYSEDFFEKYILEDELKIWEKAKESILQAKEYENQRNQNWKQWAIKRFSRFGINKDLFIPWSTLKGIFRTIFLNDEISKISWNYKNQERELKKIDNLDNFKKDLFAFLQFEDIKIDDDFLEIHQINSENKPKKEWDTSKKWPPQVVEMINKWEFEIIINDNKWQININKLEEMIKKYSTNIIAREEKILDNIENNWDLLGILDKNYNNSIYPIKIWMFKKSLSYKLFWEEMIDDLNKNFSWEEWLKESRKKWIWDKMIYLDENKNPIWWIWLSDIQILEN